MGVSIVHKKNIDKDTVVKIFIIALMLFTVVVPLMFVFVQLGDRGIGAVIRNGLFAKSVLNSFCVSIATSILSMVFAYLLAYLITRTNIRGKGIFSVLITAPMLIPSIAHGMGLIVLLGENGILTNMFHTTSNIYGFTGVLLGLFMYSFTTAYLMFYDVLKYEDRMPYVMADIMGIPKWRQFKDISLPYLRKPLISIFFATFTLAFTDYGVAMMVGGKFTTLPLFMYNEVIGQLDFGAGALSSVVLIIPALIACVFDMIFADVGNNNTVIREVPNAPNKKRDAVAYIVCIASVVMVVSPMIAYGVIGLFRKYPSDMTMGMMNFQKLWDMGLGGFLCNSLVMSALTALIGTVVAAGIAYYAARTKHNWSSKILHMLSLISLAIPGVVLGISYLLMYRGSALLQSMFMLVLINIVHFFSSPYLMCYNAFNKINGNYEVVAQTLNIGKRRFFTDILMPEIEDTMLEMFSYIFVNGMVTISAVSFLANAKNMPLSLLINQLEGQSLLECAALVSILILIVNMIVKSAIYLIKRRKYRKENCE